MNPVKNTVERGISIHAFRRECDTVKTASCEDFEISIHAFRRECDYDRLGGVLKYLPISIHAFRRECDDVGRLQTVAATISIHAFRRECDVREMQSSGRYPDFNPRIPQGMRRHDRHHVRMYAGFQSTHSAGNATLGEQRERINSRRFQSTHSAGNATRAV